MDLAFLPLMPNINTFLNSMYIKIHLIIFIGLLFSIVSNAQHTISGFVYDKETGETLAGATVYGQDINSVTTTDNNGYFLIKILDEETTELSVSYVGYEKTTQLLNTIKNRQTVFYLIRKTLLNEVTVTGNSFKQSTPGSVSLSSQQIKLIPNLTGEADILKAFQLLPGIQGGSEGSVGLLVRGGTNDQNIYLLDDVPLYYINHIGGFVSIFDASAIKSSTLYKGFFPASFGGRLSSVMDVRLKDGDSYHSKKELMIGTLNSKFFCEGPFKNNKTTYMISARLCNLGLFTALSDNGSYYFYDINAKIAHRINRFNKIYFTIYSGTDLYKVNNGEESEGRNVQYSNSYNFGNHMANFKWSSILNPFLTLNITASYSKFYNISKTESQTDINGVNTTVKEELSSSMNDTQLKCDFNYLKFSNHVLRFGLSSTLQKYRPFVHTSKQKDEAINLDSAITNEVYAFQNALYLEDNWEIHQRVKLSAGIRLSTFAPIDKPLYVTMEPRVSTKISCNDRLSIHLGYSRMAQYIHLLSNNDGGIPKDLWVPSTDVVHPEISNQFDLETDYQLSANYSFKISVYHKLLSGLIDYKDNSSSFQYWEDNVETNGIGRNKGVEFMFVKEKGRLNGYVSYVLSKSTRQFKTINNGNEYPFKYDHRNQANIVLNYTINKNLIAVGTWTYHTGNSITMAYEKYPIINGGSMEGEYGEVHVYNGRNGFRMPSYHRLDLGLTVVREKGEWHLGIYNAYNRMNPYYYYLSPKGNSLVLKQKSMFPFIPSISYTYNFL